MRRSAALAALSFLLLLPACADKARDRFEGAEKALLLQEMDAALAGFRSIPKEFPQSRYAPAALLRQGDLYGSYYRNYDAALEAYDSLVYNFPQVAEAPQAVLRKGEIHLLQFFSYAKAVEDLEYLRSRYSGFGRMDEALVLLAKAYGGLPDPSRQAEVLAELVERYPDSPKAMEGRWMQASALLGQGRFSDANRAFRKILSLAPDKKSAARARWGLAQAMEGDGDYPGALEQYEAIRNDWEDPGYIAEKVDRLRKRRKDSP